MYDRFYIDDLLHYIDTFKFVDDLSFRRLMELSPEHGISYDTDDKCYNDILDYAYDNWKLIEQTIQDYYVYEIWDTGNIQVTFSYANMNMLSKVERHIEDESVFREFIIHPNGCISGSWDLDVNSKN